MYEQSHESTDISRLFNHPLGRTFILGALKSVLCVELTQAYSQAHKKSRGGGRFPLVRHIYNRHFCVIIGDMREKSL